MLYSSRKKAYDYIFSIPFQKQLTIPAGIINGQNILNLLKGLTAKFHGYDSFLDLPVPFSCVATDIAQGNYAVLSEGNLPLSVRASMSIPAIFLPVQIDSMILVDGGVMNNLPTNVVKDMGADITIGIDLSSGPVPYKELTTFYGMATKLLDMLGEEEYEKNVKALDLCLHPDLSNFSTMDFTPEVIDSLYRIGINIARENLPRIRALRKEIYGDDYDFSQIVEDTVPVSTWNWDEKFPISSIRFDSIPAKDRDWFLKKAGLREHSEVSINEINNAISILQGLDVFSTITYNLEGKENPELLFVVKKKSQQQLNFGFRFHTRSEEHTSELQSRDSISYAVFCF